jgi:hypothetical protein
MHRRNVLRGLDRIPEHLAQFTDAGGEPPLTDMHVRPDRRQHVGLVDQATGVRDQVAYAPAVAVSVQRCGPRQRSLSGPSRIKGPKCRVAQGRIGPPGQMPPPSQNSLKMISKFSQDCRACPALGLRHGIIAGLGHGHKGPFMGRSAPRDRCRTGREEVVLWR